VSGQPAEICAVGDRSAGTLAAALDAAGYDTRMRRALAVITGDGSLDRRSLAGTLVSEVATRARQAGVPCHAVVGRNRLSLFHLRILDLQMVVEACTLDEITAAGAVIGAEIVAQRARGR
jgi:glycerate kinase